MLVYDRYGVTAEAGLGGSVPIQRDAFTGRGLFAFLELIAAAYPAELHAFGLGDVVQGFAGATM